MSVELSHIETTLIVSAVHRLDRDCTIQRNNNIGKMPEASPAPLDQGCCLVLKL